jgi:hypothetical protein
MNPHAVHPPRADQHAARQRDGQPVPGGLHAERQVVGRRELHGGSHVTGVDCSRHHGWTVPQGGLVAGDLLVESIVIREEHRPGQLRVPHRRPPTDGTAMFEHPRRNAMADTSAPLHVRTLGGERATGCPTSHYRHSAGVPCTHSAGG